MTNIICVECKVEMRPLKNGCYVIETAFDPPAPYKLWFADAKKCPSCGHVVVSGFANSPIAVHHHPDFAEELERILTSPEAKEGHVYYWHEKPVGQTDDCPYCEGSGEGTWLLGDTKVKTKCLYCRGKKKVGE